MSRLIRLRTMLLGLAVIIVTCGVFIALPALVPSLKDLNCERVLWACARRPIVYQTLIWNESVPPETAARPGKVSIVPDADNTHLIISGYLLHGYEKTDNSSSISQPGFVWIGGLPDRTIDIQFTRVYEKKKNTAETFEPKTDREGFFNLIVDIDDEMICYSLYALKDYEVINPRSKTLPIEIYMDSRATYNTCMFEGVKRHGIPWWAWLVLAMAMMVGGWFIYRYLKRKKKREIPHEDLPPAEEFEIPVPEEAKESESGGNITRLSISFPDIEKTFPDVWGVDDPLTVSFKLGDKDGIPVSSRDCEIDWGDKAKTYLVSDEDGNINSVHVFTGKGECVINASYREDVSGSTIFSWRKIRIVDYRQEMVGLFNEMLKKLELTDISIGSEMTPREIEEILRTRLEGTNETTIRRLISGFEEANYSTHPVTRTSYLNMYRSVSEVLGYGS